MQIKEFFIMKRTTGSYTPSTTLSEPVQAFVPYTLPPTNPPLALEAFAELNQQAELALARLSGASGLVPSIDWLLYSVIRKEAPAHLTNRRYPIIICAIAAV